MAPVVYVDGEAVQLPTDGLRDFLVDWGPRSAYTPVALDTETSGLFVDGDREKGAPARVSAVSLAYMRADGTLDGTPTSLAIAFDQGWRQGKLGPWDDTLRYWRTLATASKADPMWASGALWVDAGVDWMNNNVGQGGWQDLLQWLQGRPLVMHHAKFDCHIMDRGRDLGNGSPEGTDDLHSQVVWDTVLFQQVTEPLERSGLKPTAARLWGATEGDEARVLGDMIRKLPSWIGATTEARKRYDLVPWRVLGPYAGKDAELTIRLFDRQRKRVESGEVPAETVAVIDRELELSHLLLKMEDRGVEYDGEGLRAEIPKLQAAINRAAGQLPFNPATDSQAKRWFFGQQLMCGTCCVNMAHRGKEPREVEIKSGPNKGKMRRRWVDCTVCEGTGDAAQAGLGLMPIKVSEKTHEPSLDDEVVQRLVADGAEGAAAWHTLASARSALSKWYVRWPDLVGRDGRIRTSFRQGKMESDRPGSTAGGAISGRLSVERWQCQAIPQDYRIIKGVKTPRDFIRAAEGKQLWEIDLGQAEVRIAASVTKSEALRRVCAGNESVHDANTKMVFGITPDSPDWDQLRAVAKRVTFGVLYGAGVRTLRYTIAKETGFDFGEQRTREFIAAFRKAYPEVHRVFLLAQSKADRALGGCGWVRLAGGRIRQFGWAEHTSKALNQIIQGGQAEILKVAALEIEQTMPGRLVSTVHDSLWLEVDPVFVSEEDAPLDVVMAQQILCATFESYYSRPDFVVPFVSDAKRLDH